VADIYGKNVRPKDAKEAGKAAGAMKGDIPLLRKRANAAMASLRKQAGVDTTRIAAMGFCFGGTTALEMGRSGAQLKGVISIHGNLNTPKPEDGKKIQGKVLVLHGAEDPFVPPEQIKNFMDEMRAANLDWQMVYYGGAVHAFTNPKAGSDPKKGTAYHPKADQRAFQALKNFLAETL
jgi:dienelactone hydrolase